MINCVSIYNFMLEILTLLTEMNKHQKEYIYRINRVIDYIDENIESKLDLSVLSEVANFSPYHFHRIFSAYVGETLNGFITRLRLEKSASLLKNNKDTAVGDIAFTVGFNSVSGFCRAFKNRFNMSAQEYRDDINSENSKISKLVSKNSKLHDKSVDYICAIESINKKLQTMKNKFEVKEMPDMNLVYCRHVGQFHLIGEAYGKLFKWAGPRGLIGGPNFKSVTVYHDDPNITDIEKVRQSASITVEKEIKTEGEFGFMRLAGSKCVVGSFEIGPEEFETAWTSTCLWLADNGYQPGDNYPYELYHNNHEEHPEKKFIVDICIPVKPL